MPRITAPIAHAGMPKKNRTYGYSATNSRNTAISIGRMPACGRSISAPTMPGDHGQQHEEHGEPVAAEQPLDLAPEVPQDGERDDHPQARLVGERPRDDAPDLAVEDLVGPEDRAAGVTVRSVPSAAHTNRLATQSSTTSSVGVDVERADAEPRIARSAAPGEREQRSGRPWPATVSAGPSGKRRADRLVRVRILESDGEAPAHRHDPRSARARTSSRTPQGRVIYVGKASSLRQRLSNYFQDPRNLHPRTAADGRDRRVGRVDRGAQRGRGADARVHADQAAPTRASTSGCATTRATRSSPSPSTSSARGRLVMRGRKRKGTRYFGPYAHAYAIRETLDLLLRSFPIRTCSPAKFNQHQRLGRPCLLFHIEKCSGPCVGEIEEVPYRQLVGELCDFLDGDTDADRQAPRRRDAGRRRPSSSSSGRRALRDRLTAVQRGDREAADGRRHATRTST